jgi:hypothetical protein
VVAVVTTNDRYIMASWKAAMGQCLAGEGLKSIDQRVMMCADPSGALIKALGLVYNHRLDPSAQGGAWLAFNAGIRAKRFAIVAEDGVVTHVAVDDDSTARLLDATSAEAVLGVLRASGAKGGGWGASGSFPWQKALTKPAAPLATTKAPEGFTWAEDVVDEPVPPRPVGKAAPATSRVATTASTPTPSAVDDSAPNTGALLALSAAALAATLYYQAHPM